MACAEGDRPYLMCVLPVGEPLDSRFDAATAQEVFRFLTNDGRHELVIGVRFDLPDWRMPGRTKEQWERNRKMLAEIFPQ